MKAAALLAVVGLVAGGAHLDGVAADFEPLQMNDTPLCQTAGANTNPGFPVKIKSAELIKAKLAGKRFGAVQPKEATCE